MSPRFPASLFRLWVSLASAILLLWALPACITSHYKKANQEYAHVFREFQMDSDSAPAARTGRFVGTTQRKGRSYYHLQFDGILKGTDRVLDVLLPVVDGEGTAPKGPGGKSGPIWIEEAARRIESKHPAYLVFETVAPRNLDSFYAVLRLQAGEASDPAQLLREHFRTEVRGLEYPVMFAKINFSINYTYSADAIRWKRPAGGAAVVSAAWLDLGPYESERMKVRWVERSRGVYTLRQLGYIGTVPADVITAPLQLVGLCLRLLVGPGAK